MKVITEMKYSIQKLNGKLEVAEERIRKYEDMSIEIFHSEKLNEKVMMIKEHSLETPVECHQAYA